MEFVVGRTHLNISRCSERLCSLHLDWLQKVSRWSFFKGERGGGWGGEWSQWRCFQWHRIMDLRAYLEKRATCALRVLLCLCHCKPMQWDTGSPLTPCGRRVVPSDAQTPPWKKKILKSSHSQRARSVSRRGHGAAAPPLKLSLSLCHLSAPLLFSSFILSLLPPTLYLTPPPPCHFSILCLTLISPMDFLIHEGFRFALLSALNACWGDTLCSNGSILSVWQTSGITCHFIKWLLVHSSNAEAVWVKLETYSASLRLLLLLFGELIWRISSSFFFFFGQLAALKGSGEWRGLDDLGGQKNLHIKPWEFNLITEKRKKKESKFLGNKKDSVDLCFYI